MAKTKRLTAFVGIAVFGHAVIQCLLFPEVVLIGLSVSAWTRTYPTFKWPPAQHLTAAEMIEDVKYAQWQLPFHHSWLFHARLWLFIDDTWVEAGNLLPGLQSDDDEDGSPVHAAHAAAVAHKVIQDGGELSPHLQRTIKNQRLKLDFDFSSSERMQTDLGFGPLLVFAIWCLTRHFPGFYQSNHFF